MKLFWNRFGGGIKIQEDRRRFFLLRQIASQRIDVLNDFYDPKYQFSSCELSRVIKLTWLHWFVIKHTAELSETKNNEHYYVKINVSSSKAEDYGRIIDK